MREIRTLRSVGIGGRQLLPMTRWVLGDRHFYRDHQEAFEIDQTRLGYQRYDGLPQNPAQNREQFFLELQLPF